MMPSGALDDQIARLVQRMAPGSKLLRSGPLQGGVSARVIGLEIEGPDGRVTKGVLRQHGARDLRRNPRIAADAFRLLQILQADGVPVPAPRHLEPTGAIFGTPCIVLEYVDGQTGAAGDDRDAYLGQVAACLARIHAIDAGAAPFLSRRPALQTGTAPTNAAVLLHGDFWPGNVLWRDGRLVAVIDWEDAAIGDPLADLANTRLEVLWAFDGDAMDRFTELYTAAMAIDLADLPHWDLRAAWSADRQLSGWGLDAAILGSMRAKLRLFIDRARATLTLA